MKLINLSRIFVSATILLTLLSISGYAQLDQGFGTGGVVSLDVFGNDKPLASFVLPSGKILIVNEGASAGESPTYKYYFIRLNADGTRDAGYGSNGVVEIPLPSLPVPNPKMVAAVRQSDGKILLVGGASLIRYNETGTLDYTFSDDGFHSPNVDQNGTETVNGVVQQPDGKLVLVGTILNNDTPERLFLVRYELNGLLDPSFGNQVGFIIHNIPYPSVSEIVLQKTGKFLTVPQKEINSSGFYFDGAINRFNSNGTVDNTFAPVFFT